MSAPRRIPLFGAWSLVEGEGGIWHPVKDAATLIQSEADARDFAEAMVGEPTRRFRHLKRGTTYLERGRAELQLSDSYDPLEEGATIVIYQGEADGRLWAREATEFEDGRFEEIR